jgi:predicted dehydrogenase
MRQYHIKPRRRFDIMDKKVRVGIIGTGFGAKVHAPTMLDHPGFEVKAISSVARGQLDEVKKETGIETVYGNWRDMLDNEELDLVAVASAPFLHHEMVIEAYQRGYHVLCEKPMAFDARETWEMVEAQKKAQRLGFINFEFRFLPARQKVKEILSSGQLGRIMHVNYSVTFPGYQRSVSSKRGWLGQKEKAGGMLGAIGSHMFDSLLWWVDDHIESISGQLATHSPVFVDHSGEKEVRTADDSFQATGYFYQGGTFSLGLTSTSRHSIGWKLEVFGTEGTLVMAEDDKVELGIGDAPLKEVELLPELVAPEKMAEVAAKYYNAFYRSLDQIHQAITKNEIHPYLPTLENGHRVQRILDAVIKSSEEGRTVKGLLVVPTFREKNKA